MMYGGGFWVDEFFAGDHEGVVWVHGYGNVFEKALEPGETIDIEPGGWVYRDHSVSMTQEVYGFKTGFLGGGGNLVFNRFSGPGRVGLQSAYYHPTVQEGAAGNSQREGGAARRHRRRTVRQLARQDIDDELSIRSSVRASRCPRGSSARLASAVSAAGRVGGVGAGRLGPQAFLLVAPDPDPALPDAGTQISLHQPRLRDEGEMAAFTQLAAQLGYLRLSGYRLALERSGLRSKINVVNPATGAVVATIPDKHPGRLFGGGVSASRLLAGVGALPPAGPPPDTPEPGVVRQALLALALRDESLSGAEAAELADRALGLSAGRRARSSGRARGGEARRRVGLGRSDRIMAPAP